jgi:hypothetical protein
MMVWGADCGIMAMSGTDARGFAVAGHPGQPATDESTVTL